MKKEIVNNYKEYELLNIAMNEVTNGSFLILNPDSPIIPILENAIFETKSARIKAISDINKESFMYGKEKAIAIIINPEFKALWRCAKDLYLKYNFKPTKAIKSLMLSRWYENINHEHKLAYNIKKEKRDELNNWLESNPIDKYKKKG
jgi:hypothetical protein